MPARAWLSKIRKRSGMHGDRLIVLMCSIASAWPDS